MGIYDAKVLDKKGLSMYSINKSYKVYVVELSWVLGYKYDT